MRVGNTERQKRRQLAALLAAAIAFTYQPAMAEGQDEPVAVVPLRQSAASPAGRLLANSSFEAATGLDYSIGAYGAAADSSVISIPLDLKAQLGKLRLQASLPYVFIKGPGQMVGGVLVSDPGSTSTVKRNGLGDLTFSAAYLLNNESEALPAFELGGGVKLPTGKTSIGTGETDYFVTLSAYRSVNKQVMLFSSVGYSWLGSSAAYSLENGILASGGLNIRPGEETNLGVSVAYREPIAAGYSGQAVVSPYLTLRAGKAWGFVFYGMAGLNDASPRWGAGVRLSVLQLQ